VAKTEAFFIYCRGMLLSFNVAATAALIPSIALSLHRDPLLVGRMIWLYMIPYGVFALFYVPLSRVISMRIVVAGSFLLFSLANLSVGLSHNLAQIFTFRIFAGIFGASVIPLTFFIVGVNTDKQKRGRALGVFFSLTFISSLCGLFLSGIINWRYLYIIPGILGVILAGHEFFYFTLKDEVFRSHSLNLNYLNVVKDKRVYSIFLYIFIVSILYHSARQWLGVYFYETFSFGQFLISSLLLVLSIGGILGEFTGGILSDKMGRIKTLNLGIILMAAALACLIFNQRIIIYLVLLLAFFGLGWTFNHIGLSAMIADLPDNLLSCASGLNSSVRFLAGGAGALIGGIIIKHYGFRALFCIGIIGFLVLYFVSGVLKTGGCAYGYVKK